MISAKNENNLKFLFEQWLSKKLQFKHIFISVITTESNMRRDVPVDLQFQENLKFHPIIFKMCFLKEQKNLLLESISFVT